MHRKYFLLSLILLAGYLVAGETHQTKKMKTKREYDLRELFKKLPHDIGLYIARMAEEPLNEETIFQGISRYDIGIVIWVPIKTNLVPTCKSTIGTYFNLNLLTHKRREVKLRDKEPITKSLFVKQLYKELDSLAKSQGCNA